MNIHRLRAMRLDDLERVLSWRNHPDIRRFMFTQHEISMVEHKQWFEKSSADATRHLLIYECYSEPLGFVHFNQNDCRSVADWGFYTAPNAEKGSGTYLGVLALNWAFSQLNLHKVCGQALAFNEKSINFHKKMGFKLEGELRDQFFYNDAYHALICFGLLSNEWSIREIQCEG